MITRQYRHESGDPKFNAQQNLEGRTHYVDDRTLRYHHSRVLSSGIDGEGFIFWIIESYAVDPDNRNRAFRFVIFDVFGCVLERPQLHEGFTSSNKAKRELDKTLKGIDIKAHTLNAIEHEERCNRRDMDALRQILTAEKAA